MQTHSNSEIIIVIVISIIIIAGVITAGVFIYKRNKANGASLTQQFVGKKIGELCSSNEMCNSNKCVRNVCIL